MTRRPPRSTQSRSSAASDVYKRQRFSTAFRSSMSAPVIPGTCSRRDRYFTLVISKSFQSPPAGRHPPEEPNQRVQKNVSLPACSKGQTLLDVGGQVRSPPGNHSQSQPDAFLILSGEQP